MNTDVLAPRVDLDEPDVPPSVLQRLIHHLRQRLARTLRRPIDRRPRWTRTARRP